MPHTSYKCYQCHENLTAEVLAARQSQVPLFKAFTLGQDTDRSNDKPWRVVVVCANGHQNVFHGDS